MKRGLAVGILGGLLAAAGACGRSGGPRPTATVAPPVVDTIAEKAARDSTTRAREDTIRAAAETPVAPPTIPVPELPPKVEPKVEVERRCILDLTNTSQTGGLYVVDPVTKKATTYAGRGIVGNCRGQDITITADSAESYEVNDLHILIGNVHYREAKYAIDAKRVTYFRAEERLLFQDSVHAVMTKDAATLDGPQLEYWRPVRGLRTRERILATQRPRLTYIEKDSLGADRPPVFVLANTIVGEGDSTFYASGDVRIERTDVLATSDSAMLEGNRKFSRLMKGPVVESKGSQPFTLKGRVIEMYGEARQLDRILSIDSATAVSKDFTIVSDTLDMRLADRKLTRAFAFGPAGARATTAEQDIIADSLDVIMPNQRIKELHAVGKAFAESEPDTLKVRTDERDWIRGDTLIALFDSLATTDSTTPPDSTTRSDTTARRDTVTRRDTTTRGDTATPPDTTTPPIREIFASGDASAYYQVAGDSANRPGINYVTGRLIRIAFKEKAVETVTVTDQASGVYLVPAADTVARRPGAARPPGGVAAPPPRRPPAAARPRPIGFLP